MSSKCYTAFKYSSSVIHARQSASMRACFALCVCVRVRVPEEIAPRSCWPCWPRWLPSPYPQLSCKLWKIPCAIPWQQHTSVASATCLLVSTFGGVWLPIIPCPSTYFLCTSRCVDACGTIQTMLVMKRNIAAAIITLLYVPVDSSAPTRFWNICCYYFCLTSTFTNTPQHHTSRCEQVWTGVNITNISDSRLETSKQKRRVQTNAIPSWNWSDWQVNRKYGSRWFHAQNVLLFLIFKIHYLPASHCGD